MEYLGHPHILTQTVRHGRRIGHTIGIPTVNLVPPPHVLVPGDGVYIARVCLMDGSSYAAVTNVGIPAHRQQRQRPDGGILDAGF
ncbi:MAG: riboflavin kinase [Dysosmobacter sp.]